jgi:hypothetical protein
VSNPYPGQPGQPGQPPQVPPTQVVPGGPQQPGPPPGYPQQPGPPPGYPQQPQQPYGAAPGGGFPPPGPPFGAPPTGGGGGGKRIFIILAIVGVILLIIIGTAVALVVTRGDDDDDKDSDRPKVTQTITAPTDVTTPPTDVTTAPTDVTTAPTDVTTPPTTDTGGAPTEDPEIVARAYLNSLAEGNCLAVQGLSTPEWWAAAYGSQRACKRDAGNQDMSSVEYQSVQDPIENGDGTITLIATVSDSTDTSGTTYTATWILAPSDDNTVWLVSAFQLA